MSFVTKMRCARCGREYSVDEKVCMCLNKDRGRLDLSYDYSALTEKVSKEILSRRAPGVWKYHEFLPVRHKKNIVDLEAGGTPLIRSINLAEKIGLRNLYLKDETRSPTGSFKDRSMTVGVSKAVEFGATTTATASSGNAAAALAAHSAKARLTCYAFVLESAPEVKLAQIRLYGANVVRVKAEEEGKDPTVQMLSMVVEKYGWYPCPSFGPFNPYQVEGPKTMAYEIVEQLNWSAPDWVIVPTGSGCLLAGVWKGFKDFRSLDFSHSSPRLVAVQPEGCAPLVRAFRQNKSSFEIEPWGRPTTIAGGLSDVFPWDGDAALTATRETDGSVEAVSDKEILEAQKLLASTEGIFAEPTGVASLAGLIKLVREGVVKRDESIVVLITGNGLKDPDTAAGQFKQFPTISPNLELFEASVQV
ncbi:threonine synthase [Candidatus Bathyarchaeota archaeon]|nr:threonine synthase [Candidatus Bathyarchaeota archaeon]